MKFRRKAIIAGILLIICLLIHLYSDDPSRVESGYSNHFFITISGFLRYLFGWISLSIGDLFYLLLAGWLLWKAINFFRRFFSRRPIFSKKQRLLSVAIKLLIFCCGAYIIFNIFWGINYNRVGIAAQIGLKMEKYNKEDLDKINGILLDKINSSKKILVANKIKYPSNKKLFEMVSSAYVNVAKQYSFLKYQNRSLKSSMWGWLGNYAGFTGYYNPFTGEAQVNTTVPGFLQPFTACHEVAHQLGYAKEMEANFVGYLAAASSTDTLFHYSVYLDLFTYANRNLYFLDSSAAKLYRRQLDTAVVTDLKEWYTFIRRHENFIEPAIRWIYGKFLERNQQPQGILSYDEVTAFIISYYKKFGKI